MEPFNDELVEALFERIELEKAKRVDPREPFDIEKHEGIISHLGAMAKLLRHRRVPARRRVAPGEAGRTGGRVLTPSWRADALVSAIATVDTLPKNGRHQTLRAKWALTEDRPILKHMPSQLGDVRE